MVNLLNIKPCTCLKTVFPPLCVVEVDDLKQISNSVSVLLSEKQRQERVSRMILLDELCFRGTLKTPFECKELDSCLVEDLIYRH